MKISFFIGLLCLLSSSSFAGSSYDYSLAKVVSHKIISPKELSVTFSLNCNQTYVKTDVTDLSRPGETLEEPIMGVSIIVYTNHALDCYDTSVIAQTMILNLQRDIGLFSGIEFIRP